MDGGKIIRSTGATAGTDDILDVDAVHHLPGRRLGRRIAQVVAEGNERLISVAAVQIDIGIHILNEHLEEHMRQLVGLAALPVAGKDPVEVLPVLIDHGHCAVLKTGAVSQRDDDHVAVQRRDVQFIGKLNGCLDADVLRVVYAGGDQHGWPRLIAAEQHMRDVQLRTLHMDMILNSFARHQIVPGDNFVSMLFSPILL